MIVDSVVWIALKYKRDKYHEQARKSFANIIMKRPIFVTDYIIIETYAFLLRKVSQDAAIKTLEMFFSSDQIKIINNERSTFESTRSLLNQHKSLSFTDANIVYFLKNLKIKEVYSFDSGFDGIKGLSRVF